MSTSPLRRPDDSAAGYAVPDRSQIERLNSLWAIIDAPVSNGGLRSKLAGTVRRLMGRVLARQQEFNAALVDHINRNLPVIDRATERLDDVYDEIVRHRELLLARERRSEAAVAALAESQQELHTAFGVLQQAAQNLKREVGRLSVAGVHASTAAVAPSAATTSQGTAVAPASQFESLDSHKYVGFEDQFRGTPEDIRARVSEYLPVFAGTADVLDIGCGRGEFLALLRDQGVTARGIDLNPSMVEVCRSKGLDATTADAVGYLRALPEHSLGGLFAAQVVEHLEPRYLTQLLDAAFDALRPGAPIVLETINPACWFAFFESYIRDITHVRPLHPETLQYLLVASGFQQVEIRYRAPYPETDKLQPVGRAPSDAAALNDWADTINANVEKINRLLFTWLDYAAVGRRA
jgi:SAM-dependent methyltransferase